MKVSWKMEGGPELAAALNGLPKRVRKNVLREVLTDVGEPMRRRMGALAPRDPGAPDLADNIVISPSTRAGVDESGVSLKADEFQAAVAIGPARGFFYGLYQEFGTIHHGPQPFARPAFDADAPKAVTEIGRRLWVELAGRGISRSGTSDSGLDDSGTRGTEGLGDGNSQTSGGTGL